MFWGVNHESVHFIKILHIMIVFIMAVGQIATLGSVI